MSEIYNGTFTLGNTSATQIVAGPGVKVDDSVPGTIRIGTDETVLWSASTTGNFTAYNLTESPMNFEYLKLTWRDGTPGNPNGNILQAVDEINTTTMNKNYAAFKHMFMPNLNGNECYEMMCCLSGLSSTNWSRFYAGAKPLTSTAWSWTNTAHMFLREIQGINRISGGN